MSVQAFKENDETEKAVADAADSMFTPVIAARDSFFGGAYIAKPLGDVLRASQGTPIAKAINPQVFRDTFPNLFESFTYTGTFRAYLYALQKIFGEDVDVTFTIPAPGRLQVDVIATNLSDFDFQVAEIDGPVYVFSTIVDDVGDTIVFSSFLGFETQYELEQLFSEMVPQGIFVEVTLQIGE